MNYIAIKMKERSIRVCGVRIHTLMRVAMFQIQNSRFNSLGNKIIISLII